MKRLGTPSKQMRRSPLVHSRNRSAVLGLLQLNNHLSGADIARRSGLSEPTVSRAVAGLIKDKLVREDVLMREDGAESPTRGRPGRCLELDPARASFGAEIQHWTTRCAVCNIHGQVVESRSFRTPMSARMALDRIADVFVYFRNRLGADRIVGAGVCARGVVDGEAGVLVRGGQPDWVNVPVREILEAKLHEPVFLDKDVRAAALAEYTYGLRGGSGSNCFVYVRVDEGVEMGILLDGKVYFGPRMAAGELGQMVIATSPGPEFHDRSVRLEQLVSNPVICDRYSALAGAQGQPSLGDSTERVRQIARRATNGDLLARRVIEESSRYLGIGIANAVWVIDAEVIVIDGAIADRWLLTEPPLRALLSGFRGLLVVPSALRGQAALIGAAMLPFTAVVAAGNPICSTMS